MCFPRDGFFRFAASISRLFRKSDTLPMRFPYKSQVLPLAYKASKARLRATLDAAVVGAGWGLGLGLALGRGLGWGLAWAVGVEFQPNTGCRLPFAFGAVAGRASQRMTHTSASSAANSTNTHTHTRSAHFGMAMAHQIQDSLRTCFLTAGKQNACLTHLHFTYSLRHNATHKRWIRCASMRQAAHAKRRFRKRPPYENGRCNT